MSSVTATAGPVIFWGSDPVRPGEAVLLIGDGFSTDPRIQIARLKDDAASGANATLDDLFDNAFEQLPQEPLQVSDQSVKFIVPADFTTGVYAVRVGTDEGFADWLLNTPVVYWAQGNRGRDQASPGGWVRVFGRNLGDAGTTTRLRLTGQNGQAVHQLTARSAGLWDAKFAMPPDIKPGVYELQIYNGWGDDRAWRAAGRLAIGSKQPWPDKIFNVREFGAAGTGKVDDTRAVRAALMAAREHGGGVVYFPRGRYRLTEALAIPRFVTLRGERRDLVNLFWPDWEQPPSALLQGSNHFAIEDLTLYASQHQHVIAGALQPTADGVPGHVRIQRVTIRANRYRGRLKAMQIDQRFRKSRRLSTGGGDTIRLGGEAVVITDSDIYGSGRSLFLFKVRGAYVARNQFYNGRRGWYSLSGSDGVIFEDNQITGADLMSTGGGINNLHGTAVAQNVFFARNTFSLIHGWDREAITTDAGFGFYYGTARNITDRSLTLVAAPTRKATERNGWKGAGVFILGGKGMGQFAQIDRIEGDVVYLDREWKVLPDEFSVISITMMQHNYLFIDNDFTDAGVALQYYGTSINHVAAGNTSTRTAGIYNSGRWYRHYQPSWYCQFLDNEILEGNFYRGGPNNSMISGEAFIGTWGLQKPPNTAPLALAAIHRRNHLHSNAHLEVIGRDNADAPGVRDVILENNIVEHSDIGLKLDAGSVGVLRRGNVYRDVKQPVLDLSNSSR